MDFLARLFLSERALYRLKDYLNEPSNPDLMSRQTKKKTNKKQCTFRAVRPEDVGLKNDVYSVQLLLILRKHLHEVIGQFNLFRFLSAFHWSASIGKHRLTPVSFVKTTESYEVSLVTINRQTLYDTVKTTDTYEVFRWIIYEVCRLGHHLDSTFTGSHRNGWV